MAENQNFALYKVKTFLVKKLLIIYIYNFFFITPQMIVVSQAQHLSLTRASENADQYGLALQHLPLSPMEIYSSTIYQQCHAYILSTIFVLSPFYLGLLKKPWLVAQQQSVDLILFDSWLLPLGLFQSGIYFRTQIGD